MRNHSYLCIAALLATTIGAAAQTGSGCVAGDANPSSINAGCSAGGLPSVSKPLPDNGSALDAGSLDSGTTSSVTGTAAPGSQPNMPVLDVPSHGVGAETGAGGSMTGSTQGNADVSGGTSTNNRVGGSAITGTSGISTGSGE